MTPTADVSVRAARPADAALITRVQLAAWSVAHAATLGAELLRAVDTDAMTAAWSAAIEHPTTDGHGVFVAMSGTLTVGFAACAPVGDGTHEVLALEVTSQHQRQGHGSRLLAAIVDLVLAHGGTTLVVWVNEADRPRQDLLADAGLADDGTTRELAVPTGASDGGVANDAGTPATVVMTEHRWTASLHDEDADDDRGSHSDDEHQPSRGDNHDHAGHGHGSAG